MSRHTSTSSSSAPLEVAVQPTRQCRACGNPKLTVILDLGEQALTGRFPAPGEPDPPKVPLQLVICDVAASPDACGLVQLGHTCDLSEMYGPMYGYRSSITQTMVDHLRSTAERVLALSKAKTGDWLLEIGSNDGTMQNFLAGHGLNLVAIDPSAGKYADNYPKDTSLVVDFFSKEAAVAAGKGNKFKAILSIAMFYDLDRPLAFMQEVRDLLAEDGVWCFEQAYLPAILSALCYDTICHEHLCYYGLTQIDWIARHAGLRILDISMNDINGGSFTVFACRREARLASNDAKISRILAAEKRMGLNETDTWNEFGRKVRYHRARVRGFFEDARAAGDLVLGLGASTKGNVILQYAGITPDLMPAIGERDPRKVGLRTPLSGIPIISEADARKQNPKYFFAFPWHFRTEIIRREQPYLAHGGKIVFPLPQFHTVNKTTAARALNSPRKISWAEPAIFGEERVAIANALDSTMISGGEFVDEFEAQFAAMHDPALGAVSTTNGTTALQLAYLALGIAPGDEIIVPGWGFMAAANMALAIGAKPVFADITADEWLIDPAQVAALIGPKTKAIVATHTYGNVCDLTALRAIADRAGIALIEDCAESLGSIRNGITCGTVGDASCFSFQATKLITSGEGGAVLFKSPDVAARARLIRNHGMQGRKRYWHHAVGQNFRLPNILAAMLLAQLKHWPGIVTSRARLRAAYELRLAHSSLIAFQKFAPGVEPVVWAVGLRLPTFSAEMRDAALDLLDEAGIECRPGFYPPGAQPIYGAGSLAIADTVASQILVPPINAALTEDSLDHVCDVLMQALEKVARR